MNNLLLRILSGVFLATISILAVIYFPPWIFKLSVAIIAGIATWETSHLLGKKYSCLKPVSTGIFGFLSSFTILFFSFYIAILIILLYSFYIGYRQFSLERTIASSFSLIYPVLLISSLGLLQEENKNLVIILFGTVWAGDTFAYFTGKIIGKNKLAPKLSPKKTWEGAVGSLIGSIIIGTFLSIWLGYLEAIIPVIIASILMQIGDLFESFIKRQVGEKDSSSLIPGHGGLLDRIDALMFASAVFMAFNHIKNTL